MIGHTLGRQQRPQQFFRLTQADPHRLARHREPLQFSNAHDDGLLQLPPQLNALGFQSLHLVPQRAPFPVVLRRLLDQSASLVVDGLPTALGLFGSFAHRAVPPAKSRRRIANPSGDR